METPEETYERLIEEGLPPESTDPADALNKLAALIDLASDLGRPEGHQAAISWSAQLAGRELSETNRAYLHYSTGNAWASLDQLIHQNQESVWDWERPETEQEILHMRSAVALAKKGHLPGPHRCPMHTNLGNAFSKIGRFVEAHDHWNDALDLVPNFAMAVSNRGFGLLYYARHLFDTGHVALFVETCLHELQEALEGTLDAGAREPLEAALADARAAADRIGLPEHSLFHDRDLGDSPEEVAYRKWCLNRRLFLNPLNDLASHSIATADVLHLPPMTLGLDEPPSLLGYFNQLKQEFVSARYMYYEGVTSGGEVHFSDRHVSQVDTLDYPTYCLAIERVKAAFRTAYSILDKLAFFMNESLSLGIAPHRTSMRSFWFIGEKRGNGLRPEFETRANWPLRGLYWLSKDLAEDRPGFREAISPDAQGIAVVRNHLEHKYLKLHEEHWGGPEESEDPATGFSMDTLAKSLNRDDFEDKGLRLLKLARAALIYTSLAVRVEERRRAEGQHPSAFTPSMPTGAWEDDWKR